MGASHLGQRLAPRISLGALGVGHVDLEVEFPRVSVLCFDPSEALGQGSARRGHRGLNAGADCAKGADGDTYPARK